MSIVLLLPYVPDVTENSGFHRKTALQPEPAQLLRSGHRTFAKPG